MLQCILATDMARHMNDLNELKAIAEVVPSGTKLLPEGLDEDEKENRITKMLELTLHASDVSFLARPREVQAL